MARFFKYRHAEDALKGIKTATASIKGFRLACRREQNENDAIFNFVTIMAMVAIAKEKGDADGEKEWNSKLRRFVVHYESDAKRLARYFTAQQLAIAEAHRLGASNAEIATALGGEDR